MMFVYDVFILIISFVFLFVGRDKQLIAIITYIHASPSIYNNGIRFTSLTIINLEIFFIIFFYIM